MSTLSSLPHARPAMPWEMVLLGFAMAGFFDGILLHQVLQWHHLLSLVPGETIQDPRVQIAADGAFHVLMYLLLAAGLLLLWRRRDLTLAQPGRRVLGAFLLGFGGWQLVDVVLFHWILRLHHIRVDAPVPVAWDIGWLLLLGIPPLAIGWCLLRSGSSGGGRGGRVLAGVLSVVTVGAGLQALRAPSDTNAVVLFAPGLSSAQVVNGLAAADARLVEMNATGDLAIVAFDRPGRGWRLYQHGALLVGGVGPAGCAAAISPRKPA